MAGVVLLSRSICPRESMHSKSRTFSQKVIVSIVYDSRRGMSDVAFRIAPPIGGPSCFSTDSMHISQDVKNYFASFRHRINSGWDKILTKICTVRGTVNTFRCAKFDDDISTVADIFLLGKAIWQYFAPFSHST